MTRYLEVFHRQFINCSQLYIIYDYQHFTTFEKKSKQRQQQNRKVKYASILKQSSMPYYFGSELVFVWGVHGERVVWSMKSPRSGMSGVWIVALLFLKFHKCRLLGSIRENNYVRHLCFVYRGLKNMSEGVKQTLHLQDHLTEDICIRCSQVAQELCFLGDQFEMQYQGRQPLDAAFQENNWRIYLEFVRELHVIGNGLFETWLNCLRYAARIL